MLRSLLEYIKPIRGVAILLGVGMLLATVVPMVGQESGNVYSSNIVVERDVAIPMSDGVTLAADVFRPEQRESVPTPPHRQPIWP